MNGWIAAWTEKLRQHLLGGVEQEVGRLRHELEVQRTTLRDLETLRPLIGAALERQADASPAQISAALRPVIEDLVREGDRERSRRRWRIFSALAAVTAIGALVLWWSAADFGLLSVAAARVPLAAERRLPMIVADQVPVAAVLQQLDDGFGLGQAPQSDDEIVATVRARLSRCPELAGAQVSFSVKDGWVWLRGTAPEEAREAAGRVLADLGEGVLVVNQIETTTGALVAER